MYACAGSAAPATRDMKMPRTSKGSCLFVVKKNNARHGALLPSGASLPSVSAFVGIEAEVEFAVLPSETGRLPRGSRIGTKSVKVPCETRDPGQSAGEHRPQPRPSDCRNCIQCT